MTEKKVIYFNTTSEYPIDALIKHTGYQPTLRDAKDIKYEDQDIYEITITCKRVK